MAEKKLNIQEKLMGIQSELKAPKGQYNKFGKYAYRSLEDIMEAVKPLLKKYKCALTVSDNVIEVGGRVYVEANVNLFDCESDADISVRALARESEGRKGMDDSQLTGATSSYARKYAMNGLFAIDDTKDADATNDHGKSTVKQAPKKEAKPTPPKEKFESIDELKDKFIKYIKKDKPSNGTIKKLIQNAYNKGVEPVDVTAWLKASGCDMNQIKELQGDG